MFRRSFKKRQKHTRSYKCAIVHVTQIDLHSPSLLIQYKRSSLSLRELLIWDVHILNLFPWPRDPLPAPWFLAALCAFSPEEYVCVSKLYYEQSFHFTAFASDSVGSSWSTWGGLRCSCCQLFKRKGQVSLNLSNSTSLMHSLSPYPSVITMVLAPLYNRLCTTGLEPSRPWWSPNGWNCALCQV